MARYYTHHKNIYQAGGVKVPAGKPFIPTEAEMKAFGRRLKPLPDPSEYPKESANAKPSDEPRSELETLVEAIADLNVGDTIALGESGDVDVGLLIEAERKREQPRKSVLRELKKLVDDDGEGDAD